MSEEIQSSVSDTPAPIGEIEHGPSKFEQFMEKNLKKVILAVLLVIIAVAALVIMSQLGEAKRQKAGNALLSAEDPDGYRKVISDYPDAPTTGSAELLLAGQLWDEGKQDEAIKTLKGLAETGEGPQSQQAQFVLAGLYLKQDKTEDAKKGYEALVANSEAEYLHPLSLVALGDIAKASGDDEKAREYYTKKIEDYQGFADNNLASDRLMLVGIDEPNKVPPPAPEPAATGATGFPPGIDPSSFGGQLAPGTPRAVVNPSTPATPPTPVAPPAEGQPAPPVETEPAVPADSEGPAEQPVEAEAATPAEIPAAEGPLAPIDTPLIPPIEVDASKWKVKPGENAPEGAQSPTEETQ